MIESKPNSFRIMPMNPKARFSSTTCPSSRIAPSFCFASTQVVSQPSPTLKTEREKKKKGNGPLSDFFLEGSGGGLLQTGYALRRLLKLPDVKQDSHLKVKAGFVMVLFQAGLRNLYEN